jgi:Tfp pilus assembly major pilin PilA
MNVQGNAMRRQRGITLLGFIIVMAVVGVFAYIGFKLFPMYQEYYAVKSALKSLAGEPGIANTDPGRIMDLYLRRLYMNYSSNVKREHVKIERGDGGWVMTVQYEVRKPIVANLDVVGKFHATQSLSRSGDVAR